MFSRLLCALRLHRYDAPKTGWQNIVHRESGKVTARRVVSGRMCSRCGVVKVVRARGIVGLSARRSEIRRLRFGRS